MRITDEQRRARLGRRHHLAAEARATDVVDVARDLVGLHATDPSSVFLAAAARMKKPSIAAVEQALYDDRTLVRVLGMRRTLFVEPVELVPIVYASSTAGVAARNRAAIEKDVVAYGVTDDGAAWLREVEEQTDGRARWRAGQATGSQLSADVPLLRIQVRYGEGKAWEGLQGMTTRVLTQLGADGLIVRGRPRGSWTSTQYTWTPMASWLGAELPVVAPDEARVELARRWLAVLRPGHGRRRQVVDGLDRGRREAGAGHASTRSRSSSTAGWRASCWPTTPPPVRVPKPWAALLPALDPTAMGWTRAGVVRRVRTPPRCSTAPATSARRCGGAGGSWAAGASGPTARWSCTCSRTSAPTP